MKIGLLQNGNITNKIRGTKVGKKSFFVKNTCPFDSFCQVLATVFCDSKIFQDKFLDKENIPPIIIGFIQN